MSVSLEYASKRHKPAENATAQLIQTPNGYNPKHGYQTQACMNSMALRQQQEPNPYTAKQVNKSFVTTSADADQLHYAFQNLYPCTQTTACNTWLPINQCSLCFLCSNSFNLSTVNVLHSPQSVVCCLIEKVRGRRERGLYLRLWFQFQSPTHTHTQTCTRVRGHAQGCWFIHARACVHTQTCLVGHAQWVLSAEFPCDLDRA